MCYKNTFPFNIIKTAKVIVCLQEAVQKHHFFQRTINKNIFSSHVIQNNIVNKDTNINKNKTINKNTSYSFKTFIKLYS